MSFSEYRGSEQFQKDEEERRGEVLVGELDTVVKNTDGSIKYYDFLGGTKKYQLWSNEDGSAWSVREPIVTDDGSGLFPSEITQEGGGVVVQDGVQNFGFGNVLNEDEIDIAIDTIKDKTGNKIIAGDGTQKTEPEIIVDENSGDQQQASNDPPKPLEVKFGKVDSIIKKLSLRNLIYPIDADFGNTQDYMQINQFTYRAPNQKLFFAKSTEEKTQARTNPQDILGQGLSTGNPKEKSLGLVKLPMPNSLADSNNVSWGADQLNALTAAVASGVMGQVVPTMEGLQDIIGSNDGNLEKLQEFLSLIGTRVGTAFNEAGITAKALRDEAGSNRNLAVLGSSVVGSALLNAFQFGITPETILARGQGVVPNNNLSLLFNSPTLREFSFTWKLTPRSREEATRVNNIIRFFKQGMAPKKGINTATGAASYFLGTPNVFDLKFKTTTKGGNFFYEGDDINHSVVRIKTCACTGCAVNYTPDGMWNAYERGQPVSVTMSLRFAELEPIFDTDYDEDLFNYSENRPDLQPIPIDAVGY